MKAVFYHYVRQGSPDLPYFRYLPVAGFRRQLAHFRDTYGFAGRDDVFAALGGGGDRPGVLLTFDDGLADHYHHVLPALEEMGLWAMFFIPTAPYASGRLMDVHRIHILLGRHGGGAMMAALDEILSPDMLSHQHVEEFHTRPYGTQDNDAATNLFKRTLNYLIAYDRRDEVLDRLMARFCPDEEDLARSFYLSPDQIRSLRDRGMAIGSHSVSHPVFSKLDSAGQRREIEQSFGLLETILGEKVRSFAYPYGGFHTFTAETEALLAERGCIAAFNVEARDITAEDWRHRPLALPRHDCNLFPHGRASLGMEPPPL